MLEATNLKFPQQQTCSYTTGITSDRPSSSIADSTKRFLVTLHNAQTSYDIVCTALNCLVGRYYMYIRGNYSRLYYCSIWRVLASCIDDGYSGCMQ